MKKGTKVFILHGWSYSTDKWEPFLRELTGQGIEPVLLKIPGLTSPLDEVWTLENYVEWLAKALQKEKDVILLGHSNGGRIILAFTAKYPDRVKQLILIDSAGVYHDELPIKIKRLVFGTLAKVGKKFSKSPSVRKLFYKFAREHDYEKANPVVRKTMVNLIRVDLRHIFSTIKLPTVIIWGENDTITPVTDGNLMHQELTNSTLHIIKTAKHSPQFTHVEEVAKIVSKAVSL